MKNKIFTWKHLENFYLVQMDSFLMTPLRMWEVNRVAYDRVRQSIMSHMSVDDEIIESLHFATENKELNLSRRVMSGASGKALPYLCKKGNTPYIYSMETNNICNLKCKYCYLKHQMSGDSISQSNFKKIIDQITTANGLILNISGGEPSLDPNIIDNCKYAISRGLAVTCRTNLISLPEKIGELADTKRLVFAFSFHHSEASKFEEFVGKQGIFQALQRNTDILKSLKIGFYAQVNLTSYNENVIMNIEKWFSERNIPFIFSEQVFPSTSKNGLVNDNLSTCSSKIVADLIRNKVILRKRNNCTAISGKLWIGPDGSVYPCEFMKHYQLGNLFSENILLADIPESSRAIIWKKKYQFRGHYKSQCAKCSYFNDCPHCPALNDLGDEYLEVLCLRNRTIQEYIYAAN